MFRFYSITTAFFSSGSNIIFTVHLVVEVLKVMEMTENELYEREGSTEIL